MGPSSFRRHLVLVGAGAVCLCLCLWVAGAAPRDGEPREAMPGQEAAGRTATAASDLLRPGPGRTEGVRSAGRQSRRAAVLTAVRALRSWDRRRAAAYAHGDVPGLRRLYVPGSGAAAADARILRSYLARGLVVRGLRMQLLRARLLKTTGSRLRLAVEDRVVGAAAGPTSGGRSVDLPEDLPSTRVVTLEREDGARWRVRSVRSTRWPGSPGQAGPVSAGRRPAGP